MATRAKNIKVYSPAFTGQATGAISMKLHNGDHYHPQLFILQVCSTSLHKIILSELKIEKSFPAIAGQTVGGISTKFHTSSVPSLVVHITA
jgi:hypothetical protein